MRGNNGTEIVLDGVPTGVVLRSVDQPDGDDGDGFEAVRWETERAALMRLGIDVAHEMAMEEDASWPYYMDRARIPEPMLSPPWEPAWHLLLDYDREEDVPGARDLPRDPADYARSVLAKRLARAGYSITAFELIRSTNGWHAQVALDPQPSGPMEAVALQAVCGSDPLREACNVQRARAVETWDDPGGVAEQYQSAYGYWRRRFNTLYRPNPNRRKVTG